MAAGAQVRLVQGVGPAEVVLPLRVVGAGQVGAAAPRAPGAPAATGRVAEPGDGARRDGPIVRVRKVVWRKGREREILVTLLFILLGQIRAKPSYC